ncbi:MAG: GerMN domain-containing protein [Acidobacteria bacterium]|nr:GerMN domain-containing protein [Acidobacteriota bacterium]
MRRDYWLYGLAVVAVVGIWVLFIGLPRWYPPEGTSTAAAPPPAAAPIVDNLVPATLFYVSEDGMRLVGVERRLERHPDPAAQARIILEAQLAEPPTTLLSPIPGGTVLRAFYLSGQDAFVDLSAEVALGHSGGSLEELFTVYAIVNAVTTNIPAVNAVQILVNGQEVDTLVGHVDLQHPLARNLQWVAEPDTPASPGPVDQSDPL